MTTVTVIRNASNHKYREFHCFGHAGHKLFTFTKDIVCASVSVLVINTINSLEEIVKETIQVTTNEETGFIRCEFPEEPSEMSEVLVDSMVLGLTQIQKQYGNKFLEVKFEEV